MKNGLISFEHKVLRDLRQAGVVQKSVLVAVSGGVDSMALLAVLARLQAILKLKLMVGHVHHGMSRSRATLAYRKRAVALVAARAEELGLTLLANAKLFATSKRQDRRSTKLDMTPAPKKILSGEQELRDFRHDLLEQWRVEHGLNLVAFAHNQNDLLETRLLRLVRGAGVQGLRAMSFFQHHKTRPLLNQTRLDILEYARERQLDWIEDPSNRSLDPFRNWMRHKWLTALEQRSPGASTALARSLNTILEQGESQNAPLEKILSNGGLNRQILLELPDGEQKQLLAQYMRHLGMKNYSQRHISEVLKRLDNGRKSITFTLLGFAWTTDDTRVRASRV